jgi:hypothetical protein
MNPEKAITPGPGGIAYGTYHEVIEWELRAAIERYFEFLWELHWKQRQGDNLYLVSIEQRRLPITIFSCTLLECAINFYLCTKCDSCKRRLKSAAGGARKVLHLPGKADWI